MTKWVALAGVALLSIAVLGKAGPSEPKATAPQATGEHDFGRKLVLYRVKSKGAHDEEDQAWLTDARVCRVGDQFFLAGRLPAALLQKDDKSALFKGAEFWISLSEIRNFAEFDSPEAAQEFFELQKKTREGKP